MRMVFPTHRRRVASLVAGWLCAALAIAITGCSSTPKSTEDETTTDLREIAKAYAVTISLHRRPPRSLEEIKKVLGELHEAKMVGKPEEVLTSSRDGQPYEIILGADLGASRSPEILAYEKQGKDGTRYVLTMTYDVQQLSDAEFAQATFAAGHKPARAKK
jgi:hypothetical protein